MSTSAQQPLMIEVASSPTMGGSGMPTSATNTYENRRKEAWGDTNTAPQPVKQAPNPIKSQSGNLHFYIHGFIKRKQELRLKSVDTYSLECSVFPEESLYTYETNQFNRLPSSIDFDGHCMYSKQISIPVAWALEQVSRLWL